MIRIKPKHLITGLAALPFAAVLFAWSGIFDVSASSGHWKITEWFLHFAMRSSVRTHALAVKAPDELPRHALKPAAGHFARGCAICHGAPGEPRSPAALRILPPPPDLAGIVDEWTDPQLFQIVKHGVKYTGMPAWPTQERDDEVWAMVAFLRELPGLDAERYRELAYGDAEPALGRAYGFEEALAECSRCHGRDGQAGGESVPVLAGQSETYLLASLSAYLEGSRPSGIMEIPARAVEPEFLPELARHFAAQPRIVPARTEDDSALHRRGETIARNGISQTRVPACLECHGRTERNPLYPNIAGQHENYIAGQLELFRDGMRGGTRYNHLMRNAAKNLTDGDIEALAAYFSRLQAPPENETP
ncbi:c-type cytochrome [Aquamicrobium sp. LC103]|uniref:c-type cytochrome n=1 Tax=Aquamicrobium sp. LC103 TaxID=1120658 RepID=UPI00069951C5|nr:c-type cytochrome [Aquamicrobium sp. LC103]TKT76153.1 c-type cytochrome [Aquamicrobium sp. LC103]